MEDNFITCSHSHEVEKSSYRKLMEGIFGGSSADRYCPWENRRVTWNLYNLPAGLSEAEVLDELSSAFDLWMMSSSLDPVFVSEDAQINIGFFSSDEKPVLFDYELNRERLGYAFLPCSDERRGWVYINTRYPWANRDKAKNCSYTKLFCVATHEIGHALGIGPHGRPKADVMQKNPLLWRGKITSRDRKKIHKLYPYNNGAPNA